MAATARGWAVGLAVVVGTAAGAGALGQAGEPLVTDRPDFTESAVTVGAGRVQVESGATAARGGGVESLTLGEILVRIGLGERWELRLAPGSYRWEEGPGRRDAEGWEDASAGVKVAIAPGAGARPAVGAILAAGLPTGDAAVGGDAGVQPEAVLALAWDLAPRLGLGANLGWARPRDDGRRFDQPFASAALGWEASPRLGLFAEAFGFARDEPGGDAVVAVDAGATWLLGPDRQLDLRLGREVDGGRGETFAGVGFSARW